MTKKIILIFSVMITANCSTIKSTPYDAENISKTLYYALPKTYLNITIEIQRKEITNAKYIGFAECYGIISDVKKPSKSFTIKSIYADTGSELDATQVYETQVVNGFLNKTEFNNIYNTNGELTSSDYKTESQGLKYVTSTVKFATSLFFNPSTASAEEETTLNSCLDKFKITGKEAEKIKKLLKRIEDLNGNLELINENASDYSSPVVLKEHIKSINDEKNKILEDNFGFSTDTKLEKLSFRLYPSDFDITEKDGEINKPDKRTTLFKYDKDNGIIGASSGKLDSIVWKREIFEAATSETNKKVVEVQIDLDINNEYAKKIKANNVIDSTPASFLYRSPSFNKLLVYLKSTNKEKLTYVKDNIQLTQFGRVVGAPMNLAKVKYELYPKTGALKSISGNSAVVDVDQLSALQSQIADTKTAMKGEEDIDVEIKDLKKEVELLELIKKKADLEKVDEEDEDSGEEG